MFLCKTSASLQFFRFHHLGQVAEDIPFATAKAKVASISRRMNEVAMQQAMASGGSLSPTARKQLDAESMRLEKDMEKYHTAMTLSDEWIEEQHMLEEKWRRDNSAPNRHALESVQRMMPVNVKYMSEKSLSELITPSGQPFPQALARKYDLVLFPDSPVALANACYASSISASTIYIYVCVCVWRLF